MPFQLVAAGTTAAITIAANSVVLELNANKMGDLKNGMNTETVGITSTERRKNITIQNGAVRGLRIVNFMPPRFVRS